MVVIDPFRPLSGGHKAFALLIGAFVVLYCASCLLTNNYGSAFFAIPVFVGFIAGMVYPQRPFITALYALLVALGLAIVTLREGVICVLFSLPVLLPMLWLGTFAGSVMVRHVHTERARRSGARHLAPDLYFGWLQQTVMERAQRRLLELLRNQVQLDEAGKFRMIAAG